MMNMVDAIIGNHYHLIDDEIHAKDKIIL